MSAELQEDLPPRKLSFPFAKRHGVLVRGIVGDFADTVCRPGVTPQTLAEVRRFVGVPLKLERVSVEKFDSMLRIAYEAGSGAAMQMLEGLDDNTDLAHGRGHSRVFGSARERRRRADDPHDQRAPDAGGQGTPPTSTSSRIENRLVRFRVDGTLREVLPNKRAWRR